MNKLFLGTAAVVAITISPALAADMRPAPVVKAPVMVPAQLNTWAGFYIGGQVGGAWSNSDYTVDNGLGVETFNHDPSSIIGGAHAGVQGQWGSWVLGVEGTYSWTNLDSTNTSVLFPGQRRSLTLDSISSVVGKVGMASDNWLFYVKGGWAMANIDTFANNPATGVSFATSGMKSGWTVGGGVDYMLTSNWIAGVDVNYYRFDFDRSTLATDGTPSRYFDTNSDIYAVMGRLSYKFGR